MDKKLVIISFAKPNGLWLDISKRWVGMEKKKKRDIPLPKNIDIEQLAVYRKEMEALMVRISGWGIFFLGFC